MDIIHPFGIDVQLENPPNDCPNIIHDVATASQQLYNTLAKTRPDGSIKSNGICDSRLDRPHLLSLFAYQCIVYPTS